MHRYKYGRTYHLPFSQGLTTDDKMHPNPENFNGKDIIVTLKMDGENTALYQDGYTHARSVDSANHISREWLKQYWANCSYLLPKGWRVYGENLYAQHSIRYDSLTSYFQVFSVYDENNIRLDWDTMKSLCSQLDMDVVKCIARLNSKDCLGEVEKIYNDVVSSGEEGIVITTESGFHFDSMSDNLAKAVRKGHVQTDEHWMHSEIVKNGLSK